jgi:hypothetical protein
VSGDWTASTTKSGIASTYVMKVSKDFNVDPVIKVGATFSYKAGYVYIGNVNTCFSVGSTCRYKVDSKGSSQTTTWTAVDGASSLVMSGVVATILAVLF